MTSAWNSAHRCTVLWGGREGTDTDAAKNPLDAGKRFREATNFLCAYVLDHGYDLKFALEAKPNEPRGDLYLATTGHMLAFIATLDHPEMVGVNPEVAHEQMAGLNFLHNAAQAWDAGKLFHIDLNDQNFARYDQDFRFGSHNLKQAFFLVKFLEDVGYGGGAKSALWRQILADVLNAEFVTVNTTEGAAYSAALLAGVGAGRWSSVEAACDATIRLTGQVAPVAPQTAVYDKLYAYYRALYPALKPTFDGLA